MRKARATIWRKQEGSLRSGEEATERMTDKDGVKNREKDGDQRDGNNEGRDKAGGLGNCLGNIMNEPQCV